MGNEHWFDGFSKTALQAATRREVARSVAVLLPSLLCGGLAEMAVAKNKRGNGGGKGPGKKPKKPKKPPAEPCSGGACHREFVLPDNREYCEFICRQCDSNDDPRHFCIVDADPRNPDNPMKIAVCCAEGETCCDDYCCPEGHACCDGNQCCRAGHTCCGGSCCGTDNPWTACCDGMCVTTEIHNDHCGACGNACLPNETCYLGGCECTRDCDDDPCLNCPHGQFCWDGINCSCGNGFKYCPLGEACIREEYVCCGDTQSSIRYCFDEAHCCGSGADTRCSPTPCP